MDNKISFRKAGIALAYPLAYLYLRLIWRYDGSSFAWIAPTVFCVLFTAFNEIVLRGRKDRSDKRAYFWYAIMIITAATSSIAPSMGLSMLAIHLGAVYSVLISNDILVEKQTGSLIWLDLLCGFFVKTFPNMGAFVSDRKEISDIEAGGNSPAKKRSMTWIIPVAVLLPFFFISMALLSSINATFGNIIEKVFDAVIRIIDPNRIFGIVVRMLLAIPVCVFLYGLISSSAKSNGESERFAGQKCRERSEKRRTVSSIVTGIVTGSFVMMYILFFVVEFRYIFSGFMGRLPEGFNVVDYARRGFFELVGVMAINMFVYVIVNGYEKRTEGKKNVSGYMMIALMVESILFAVVSLSKLLMYFNMFGYTPKRMLAMWGTVILAAAALVVIISVIKGKAHARAWILFTACSYVLMCIISGVFIAVDYHGDAGISMRDEYIIYIDNESDTDIASLTLYADGNQVYSVSDADDPVLIPCNNGSYTLIIKADDLPEDSDLKDSDLRIEFNLDDEGSNYYLYVIDGEREEEDISRSIVIGEYGVRTRR